ncbi:TipAS antibiotic-recognition domain-containing protein [Candidatus Palauibacter sp.]|uniref:TipAS antibiotic-recognition domain-containing protein n=1 Tax=Candidatus Palauibacter sp. TaxID=3101350 RepID=UPI003B022686
MVDRASLADEARRRWGHTDAWRESVQGTRGYSEADWARIRAESDDVFERMAVLIVSGASAESTAIIDLAQAHRRHVDRWFYPCNPDMHRGLAAL